MEQHRSSPQVAIKLTILSGTLRGRTISVSRPRFRLGTAEDCDLRFDEDHGVEPYHAELVEENCEAYLRKSSPEAKLAVDQQETEEIILRDKDLISLGLAGPKMRVRLPRDKFLHCKSIMEICRDCIDVVRLAEAPVYRKAGIAASVITNELRHQTTRVFKLTLLAVLIGFLAAAGGYVSWNAHVFRQFEAALVQADRELQMLHREFGFAPAAIRENNGGVAFIIGTYGFVEKGSGKPVRFAGSDGTSEPPEDASGQARLVVGGPGAMFTRSFNGSGFLVSQDGRILTNHHVAEPWIENEPDKEFIENGFEPRLLSFMAYFPGDERGYPLTVIRNSSTADVSLLQVDLAERHPPVLTLSDETPRAGEPVLLLGYPGGYDALLARYGEQTIAEVMAETPSTWRQLSQALARRELIRPIATHGHLGDVVNDRLVYDAETTHGGSGGPILNSRGEVIGITSAIFKSFSGSNFGVPVDQARGLLEP